MTFGGPCLICGQDVMDADFAAYPVTGWEFTRLGGGANQIVLRERVPGKIAHRSCVEALRMRQRSGVADDQLVIE